MDFRCFPAPFPALGRGLESLQNRWNVRRKALNRNQLARRPCPSCGLALRSAASCRVRTTWPDAEWGEREHESFGPLPKLKAWFPVWKNPCCTGARRQQTKNQIRRKERG